MMKNKFKKINVNLLDKNIKKDIKKNMPIYKLDYKSNNSNSKLVSLEITLQNCVRTGFLK